MCFNSFLTPVRQSIRGPSSLESRHRNRIASSHSLRFTDRVDASVLVPSAVSTTSDRQRTRDERVSRNQKQGQSIDYPLVGLASLGTDYPSLTASRMAVNSPNDPSTLHPILLCARL